jgi:hypothetical protein
MLKAPLTAIFSAFACQSSLALPFAAEFEAGRSTATYFGDMDLDDGPGSLDVMRFDIRALLSRPISPWPGLIVVPVFEYRLTHLDFDGVPDLYPIRDEELHSLNLSAFAISRQENSPWFYGGWARTKMNSDFQDITDDDFMFDLAGGAGYSFDSGFTLGTGVAVLNLNGNVGVYPGIFFNWEVNDHFRMGLYGPIFTMAYSPDSDWTFSFRAETNGEISNITDDNGNSKAIDFTTYRLGVYVNRRLADQLWLRIGTGFSVGNKIELTDPDGDRIFKQDMDHGLFSHVALRLLAW